MKLAMTMARIRLLGECQHRSDRPCILQVGDGVIDWYIRPAPRQPAGRYRITKIKRLEDYPGEMVFMEYMGPSPQSNPED